MPGLALSTANLWAAVQPGGSLDGADIGVVQRRRRLGFAHETGLFLFTGELVDGRELQRNRATQLGVLGFVGHTHPAFTELGDDFVVADSLADHDGSIVPSQGLLLITIDVTRYRSEPDPHA